MRNSATLMSIGFIHAALSALKMKVAHTTQDFLRALSGFPQRTLRFKIFAPVANSPRYSNLAFIVILAFSTFDTGQPFSAASAYF